MPKVLVIDDDPGMLSLMQAMLNRYGHEVLHANNGIEGISLAQAEQPDLILLDVLLPTFGGIKILEHLRSDEKTARTPIIVITAAGSDILDKIAEMGERGPDDLLTKPFVAKELLASMQKVLGQEE